MLNLNLLVPHFSHTESIWPRVEHLAALSLFPSPHLWSCAHQGQWHRHAPASLTWGRALHPSSLASTVDPIDASSETSPAPACGPHSWDHCPVLASGLLGGEWTHQPCVGRKIQPTWTPKGCHQPGEAARQRGPFFLRSSWPCKKRSVSSFIVFIHRGGLKT